MFEWSLIAEEYIIDMYALIFLHMHMSIYAYLNM